MPTDIEWFPSMLLPKTPTEALAILLIGIGIVLILISFCSKLRTHALRLAGIGFVLSLALFANYSWTYFVAIFIIATVITELEFLQNLAAIIARDPNYWKYKNKPRVDRTDPPSAKTNPSADAMGFMELKVLNTLWVLQIGHYPNLESAVTFTIEAPPSQYVDQQYAEYLVAIGRLMQAKLLSQSDKRQVCLTLEGLKYCSEHYKEFPPDRWYIDELPIDPDKLEILLKKIRSITGRT